MTLDYNRINRDKNGFMIIGLLKYYFSTEVHKSTYNLSLLRPKKFSILIYGNFFSDLGLGTKNSSENW